MRRRHEPGQPARGIGIRRIQQGIEQVFVYCCHLGNVSLFNVNMLFTLICAAVALWSPPAVRVPCATHAAIRLPPQTCSAFRPDAKLDATIDTGVTPNRHPYRPVAADVYVRYGQPQGAGTWCDPAYIEVCDTPRQSVRICPGPIVQIDRVELPEAIVLASLEFSILYDYALPRRLLQEERVRDDRMMMFTDR